jgi:hypothetical protein
MTLKWRARLPNHGRIFFLEGVFAAVCVCVFVHIYKYMYKYIHMHVHTHM